MDTKTELLDYIKTHPGHIDFEYCQNLTSKLNEKTDHRQRVRCVTHLAKLRQSKQISRQMLAEMVEIPVGMYAKYESGHAWPSEDRIDRLADFFEIQPRTLRQYLADDLKPGQKIKCTRKEGAYVSRLIHQARRYYTPRQIMKSCVAFGCHLSPINFYRYAQCRVCPYKDEYRNLVSGLQHLLKQTRYL